MIGLGSDKNAKLCSYDVGFFCQKRIHSLRFPIQITQDFEEVKEKIRLLTCEVAEYGDSLDRLDIKCRNMAVANSCLDVRVCAHFWEAAQTALAPWKRKRQRRSGRG